MDASNDTMHDGVPLYPIGIKIFFYTSIVIAVSTLLIDTAIIIAFLVQKTRRNVRVSPAGVLVLNLLFADSSYCAYQILLASSATWSRPCPCSLSYGLAHLTAFGSYTALTNVVVDRYIATRHALKYRKYMTRRRSVVMVCSGWLFPVSGLVGCVASFDDKDWHPEQKRPFENCGDMHSFKMFVWCVFVPSHFLVSLIIVAIQSHIYSFLRRQDAIKVPRTTKALRMFSDKSRRILYRIIIPLCILTLSYDVLLLVALEWFNWVILHLLRLSVIFVQIAFLLNIFLYSLATASIRGPVCHLYADFQIMMRRSTSSVRVAIIGTMGSFQWSSSSSRELAQ